MDKNQLIKAIQQYLAVIDADIAVVTGYVNQINNLGIPQSLYPFWADIVTVQEKFLRCRTEIYVQLEHLNNYPGEEEQYLRMYENAVNEQIKAANELPGLASQLFQQLQDELQLESDFQ